MGPWCDPAWSDVEVVQEAAVVCLPVARQASGDSVMCGGRVRA